MAQLRSHYLWNTALFSAVFLIIIDRLAKVVALQVWHSQPVKIVPGLFLTVSKNYSLAFSLKSLINPLFLIIPLLIILLVLLITEIKKNNVKTALPLFFILVGAASNLYDRLAYGYVIDYIDLKYFTVFNIADVMICCGILFLIKKYTLDK